MLSNVSLNAYYPFFLSSWRPQGPIFFWVWSDVTLEYYYANFEKRLTILWKPSFSVFTYPVIYGVLLRKILSFLSFGSVFSEKVFEHEMQACWCRMDAFPDALLCVLEINNLSIYYVSGEWYLKENKCLFNEVHLEILAF